MPRCVNNYRHQELRWFRVASLSFCFSLLPIGCNERLKEVISGYREVHANEYCILSTNGPLLCYQTRYFLVKSRTTWYQYHIICFVGDNRVLYNCLMMAHNNIENDIKHVSHLAFHISVVIPIPLGNIDRNCFYWHSRLLSIWGRFSKAIGGESNADALYMAVIKWFPINCLHSLGHSGENKLLEEYAYMWQVWSAFLLWCTYNRLKRGARTAYTWEYI